MAKFRKKPIIIDAIQWVGPPEEMPIPPAPHTELKRMGGGSRWALKTLEGWFTLTPGDFIITGSKGELYPCKPDIFELTYEPI